MIRLLVAYLCGLGLVAFAVSPLSIEILEGKMIKEVHIAQQEVAQARRRVLRLKQLDESMLARFKHAYGTRK